MTIIEAAPFDAAAPIVGRTIMQRGRAVLALLAVAVAAGIPSTASATTPPIDPVVTELATFAAPACAGGCGSGSTVGPDEALYVTDGPGGRVLRVDPETGTVTTFARGLPPAIPEVGIGGAIDVVFAGGSAYVLVTLVGPFFGQNDVVNGIYRIADHGTATAIADIGAWSMSHPPATDFFIASGVQYALEQYRGGFLVTDGHHNRVLRVTRAGDISETMAFGNIVPTGLEVHGRTIHMGEAGPIPHLPPDGKVVRFTPKSAATELASGASLIVDVEPGSVASYMPCHKESGTCRRPPRTRARRHPRTREASAGHEGRKLHARRRGARPADVPRLHRQDRAFVVTLTGKVLAIDHLGRLGCGDAR